MSENLAKIKAPSESLFSKKNRKLLIEPLTDNNPVTVQVLGICSSLAITVKMDIALVMGLSVIFVTAMGNYVISALRNIMPPRIRIIVQLVVAAALVIIVNEILKAYLPDISEQLSVFVGLISCGHPNKSAVSESLHRENDYDKRTVVRCQVSTLH